VAVTAVGKLTKSVFGWMMPGDVKVFATDQLREAIDWAAH
jgi:hypothetical protein